MKLSVMKNLLFLVGFAFLLTSCDPDSVIDPPGLSDPTVSVSGNPAGEIAAGETFILTVTGTPTTDNALRSVAFKEDNTNIPFGRITVDGTAASSNPILLFGDDKNGFTWSVAIEAHADASVKQYEVEITDEGNNVGQFTFDVTTAINLVEPTLTIAGNMAAMVPAGTLFKLDATLGMGTFDLASMSFFQGTEEIAADRIEFAGTTIDANPYLLPDEYKDGGEAVIFLRVQDEASTETYRFVLTDADGNSVDYSFDIITGTNVEALTGVLFNAGGPAGTGGLDLDTGDGTGSSDAAAELRDLGIDTDEPAATNWIQRIAGANDAEVKYIRAGESGTAEGFTFEDVGSKEMIASLHENNGIDFTAMSGDDEVSDVVAVGDIFSVNRDGNYYLVVVREVNIITAGSAEDLNKDNYVVDIKK